MSSENDKEKIIQLWKKTAKYKIAGIPIIRYFIVLVPFAGLYLTFDFGLSQLKTFSKKVCLIFELKKL
jgi:hypothetical protein